MEYIEVKLVKCTVFLTPGEINFMLQREPAIFQAALQRGKGILRARAANPLELLQIKGGLTSGALYDRQKPEIY